MSRIGIQPVEIPDGVEVNLTDTSLTVSGSEGELTHDIPPRITVTQEEDPDRLVVETAGNTREDRSLHGTTRSIISNMVQGVSDGFEKKLRIRGTGYKARMKGSSLEVIVGHTDDKVFPIPDGLSVEVPNETSIVITGADKQQVGQFASEVRAIRPPDVYTEKGISYEDEQIRTKEGKKFVSGV